MTTIQFITTSTKPKTVEDILEEFKEKHGIREELAGWLRSQLTSLLGSILAELEGMRKDGEKNQQWEEDLIDGGYNTALTNIQALIRKYLV